jgi:hypothetical protein
METDKISKILRKYGEDELKERKMFRDPLGIEAFQEFKQEDPRTKAIEQIVICIKNLEIQKRELLFRIRDDFRRITREKA